MSIIDEIMEVERACFEKTWSYEALSFEINSDLSILKCERREGKIVAFVLGRAVMDEGEILIVATLPQYRRQGIAEKLLSAILEEMRQVGAGRCFLEVRSRNAAAIALYEKHGFKKIGLRKRYYPDDDAITMAAEL